LDLLARLIMAETETQPYEAKVAVGSVVVNRVKSGLFAPTIKGVINQNINGYYQFTPVENGWIKRPANEECIKAAKEALSGVDTTNGALFYYDDSSTNQWILSKPVAVQYGRMIYAY
jgi:N-acetylmuramoyl-L-alanine amidase